MPFCSNCGTQLADSAKFCPSCGAPVGTVRICPSCSAPVEAFQMRCASCGREFDNAKVANSVESFFNQLLTIKNAKDRENYIKSFPIPNTKEDLLEFAIAASSQLMPINPFHYYLMLCSWGLWRGPDELHLNRAWKAKLIQVYKKARLSMAASDPQGFAAIKTILREAHITV